MTKLSDYIFNCLAKIGVKDVFMIAAEGYAMVLGKCAFLGKIDPAWPHLNPELAAKLAVNAVTKRLALTHFDANVYRDMGLRKHAERTAKRIFGKTICATDGSYVNM